MKMAYKKYTYFSIAIIAIGILAYRNQEKLFHYGSKNASKTTNENVKNQNIIKAHLASKNSDTISPPIIKDKPIDYGKERVQLSIEYLKIRHGIDQQTPTINPRMIVLHYTDGGTVNSIHNYFNATQIEAARNFNKKQSLLNVSSQFLIDRDGTIYRLMPDNYFARHTIGLNYCAIGVENIGDAAHPLTPKQVSANAALVRYLTSKYAIEFLIGHSESGIFRKSSLWKETDPKYYTDKSDPGEDFMVNVRKLVKDLNLKSRP